MRRVPEIHCALARLVRGCGRATVSVFRLRPIVDELDAPLARGPLHAPRQQIRLVSHPVAGRRESRRNRPEWARRAPARSSRSAPGLPPRPRLAPQERYRLRFVRVHVRLMLRDPLTDLGQACTLIFGDRKYGRLHTQVKTQATRSQRPGPRTADTDPVPPLFVHQHVMPLAVALTLPSSLSTAPLAAISQLASASDAAERRHKCLTGTRRSVGSWKGVHRLGSVQGRDTIAVTPLSQVSLLLLGSLGRCWSSLPSSLRLCRLRCSSSSSRSLAG